MRKDKADHMEDMEGEYRRSRLQYYKPDMTTDQAGRRRDLRTSSLHQPLPITNTILNHRPAIACPSRT